jgi:hypothetical protein
MANKGNLALDLSSRFDVSFGLREFEAREPFTCGVHEIDTLLQGGFPRAALSEIAGAASTNRTALMVSILARAFDAGKCCAWIDSGGTFDPESAAAAGLQLNRLLWVNCKGNPEHALKATDLLLHGGGFGLMVFDIGDTSDSLLRRMPMASWYRLRLGAEKTGTNFRRKVPRISSPRLCRENGSLGEIGERGRINPKGIPCLYLADRAHTAMSEVRPGWALLSRSATSERNAISHCWTVPLRGP